MNKKGWIGKALLGLAIFLPVAGLAVSVYLSSGNQSPSNSPSTETPAAEEYVLTAADFPEVQDTGNQVGYRIPDVTMELYDGTTVTSASLVEQGRPTYLFFWATI